MDALHTPPDRIAEANHRMANSLTLLSGLVRMQARHAGRAPKPLTNAEVRLMFDSLAARIATLGQLHRMLAHAPADDAIDLNRHLRDLGDMLMAAFSSDQQPMAITHRGDECRLLAKNVQPLTLVLCELLTNAMKYAHPSGVPLHIGLCCEAHPNGDLVVRVSDDGVGLPDGFDTEKDGGSGFQIVRALTAEMGARLETSSTSLGLAHALIIPRVLAADTQMA